MSRERRLRDAEDAVEVRFGEDAPRAWEPPGPFAAERAELARNFIQALQELDERKSDSPTVGRCIVCDRDTEDPVLGLTSAVAVHAGCLPGSPDRG